MAEPLVGRAEHMAALADLARRVEVEGRPGAVLVLGPPGQGKSRLLAEARARARAHVLTMVGYEPERLQLASPARLPSTALLDRVPPSRGALGIAALAVTWSRMLREERLAQTSEGPVRSHVRENLPVSARDSCELPSRALAARCLKS